MSFEFQIQARDEASRARVGIFQTPHGPVRTPVFMPVGTRAAVKAISPDELRNTGCQIVLANAYHLYLQPGSDVVERFGGLHGYMGWNGPILTDSGGFQVLSLSRAAQGTGSDRTGLVQIDEEGVLFRSHLDGTAHRITPELAIDIQNALGADVIMAFDHCSSKDDDYAAAKAAMERTHRWTERCVDRWQELAPSRLSSSPQALFAIVQGGSFPDLRRISAEFAAGLGLAGIAIGGEAIGYSKPLTRAILEWIADLLPEDKPRYAMGIGEPEDFFAVIERGVDLFDSVLPTRVARNGTLLTGRGRLRLLSARYRSDPRPIESDCGCQTCQSFSRAYVRHLFKCREPLAYRLATIHNLHFCLQLVNRIRDSILTSSFIGFRDEFQESYQGSRLTSAH